MADIDLRVRLDARGAAQGARQLGQGLGTADRQARRMATGLDRADREIDKVRNSLLSVNRVLGAFGVTLGVEVLRRQLFGAVEAFQDLQREQNLVEQSVRNLGLAYDDVIGRQNEVLDSLFQTARTTQGEALPVLRQLIALTGDYERALASTGLALDVAAQFELDNIAAARLLGRVLQGDISILSRYGIRVETAAEALELLRTRSAGAAAAGVTDAELLSKAWGDFQEEVGEVLTESLELDTALISLTGTLKGLNDEIESAGAVLDVLARIEGVGISIAQAIGRGILEGFNPSAIARSLVEDLFDAFAAADPLTTAGKRFAALDDVFTAAAAPGASGSADLTPEAQKAVAALKPLVDELEKLRAVRAVTDEFGLIAPGAAREPIEELVELRSNIDDVRDALALVPEGAAEFGTLLSILSGLNEQVGEAERGIRRAASVTEQLDALEIPVPEVAPIRAFVTEVREVPDPIHRAGDETESLADQLFALEGAGRGLLAVADSIDSIDDSARRALTGVLDLAQGFKAIEDASSALGIVSGAGAIVGAGFGILSSLFAGSPSLEAPVDAERNRLIESNTDALDRLTREMEGLRLTGGVLTGAIDVVRQTFRVSDDPTGAEFFDTLEDIEGSSTAAGARLKELEAIADEFGITLIDSTGHLVDGALEDFRSALQGAIDNLTGFGDSLDAVQRERGLRDRILGVKRTPAEEFSALVGDLSAVAPDLAEQFFGGLDPSNTDALRSALLGLVDAFDVGGTEFAELLGGLTREDFLGWLDQAAGSLEELDENINATTNAIRNVPSWFRVQSAILDAADPDPVDRVVPPDPPTRTPVDLGPLGAMRDTALGDLADELIGGRTGGAHTGSVFGDLLNDLTGTAGAAGGLPELLDAFRPPPVPPPNTGPSGVRDPRTVASVTVNNEILVQQQPGEDGEAFARRVAQIVTTMNSSDATKLWRRLEPAIRREKLARTGNSHGNFTL